jgi:transcriptional regulator with XRE-family HTH domain
MSQRDLAKEIKSRGIKISHGAINELERWADAQRKCKEKEFLEKNEKPNPTYKIVSGLADYFGVTMDYLMGVTDCAKDEIPPYILIVYNRFEETSKLLYELDSCKEMKR